jgi:hypothetical protein
VLLEVRRFHYRIINQVFTKASRMAMPNLPHASMSLNGQPAGIFVGFDYIFAAETTWPELN